MPRLYEYELARASDVIVNKWAMVRPGDEVMITASTEDDNAIVDACAASVYSAGAIPMVIYYPKPPGVGKAADPGLPVKALAAAACEADIWIQLSNAYLLYSTPYEEALKINKKLKFIALGGMDREMMDRLIGTVDNHAYKKFWVKISKMTEKAKTMRVTTPAGTDLTFENDSNNPLGYDIGIAEKPGPSFLSGQIGWAPKYDSINGKLVFDGSLTPPCGILRQPVELAIEKGKVISIRGGAQAEEFRKWLDHFQDPNMYRLAHICYGFHPGAVLSGHIIEDERVWGCTEWGIGYYSPMDAPPDGIPAISHTDGICLNSSIWLDNIKIVEEGRVIHTELMELLP